VKKKSPQKTKKHAELCKFMGEGDDHFEDLYFKVHVSQIKRNKLALTAAGTLFSTSRNILFHEILFAFSIIC
jgi:hypothetical protein